MANITQLKHLEHIEDEMLNYGVQGCIAAVSAMRQMTKMLGEKKSSSSLQTKWDGAPAVVCGPDPANGRFFVGTKSAFNKDPKICYTVDDVEIYYGDASPNLKDKLKQCITYFPALKLDRVVQGDLLFTPGDKKTETIDGESLITFRPNTITYGIPVDHPIGQKVNAAKIGIVFHTQYSGKDPDLSKMTASTGGGSYTDIADVAVINNDTQLADIAIDEGTMKKFNNNVTIIDQMCKKAGKFLDTLVDNMGTTGDKKYHVASYLKQFFNNEIKAARNINDPKIALKGLGEFYHQKMQKEVDKMKSPPKIAQRRNQLFDGLKYLEDNEQEFHAMFALYRKIQENKTIVINALDKLETFRTFAMTEKGYKVTGPEGYVLHHDGDMIKLVNRIEFSYINFTLAKQWR